MTYDRAKALLLALKPLTEQVEVLALEEPVLEPDSVAGLICPNCGEMEARREQVIAAEVERSSGIGSEAEAELMQARCPCCGCVFSCQETQARAALNWLFERRARRIQQQSRMGFSEYDKKKRQVLSLLGK